jgi:hypothetical protein
MQSPEARPPMMLHLVFVASVLEGFEGTLDEMIGRVANPKLNSQLDALLTRAFSVAKRVRNETAVATSLREGGAG